MPRRRHNVHPRQCRPGNMPAWERSGACRSPPAGRVTHRERPLQERIFGPIYRFSGVFVGRETAGLDGTVAKLISVQGKKVTDVSLIGEQVWVSARGPYNRLLGGNYHSLGLVNVSTNQTIAPPTFKVGPARFALAPDGSVWAIMRPQPVGRIS
jgi:hypothetical protein